MESIYELHHMHQVQPAGQWLEMRLFFICFLFESSSFLFFSFLFFSHNIREWYI